MHLNLESGKTIKKPTDEDIASSLPVEEFAILSEGPDSSTFLQFAEGKEPPYDLMLEFQISSLDEHFRAVQPELTMEEVIEAFQKYARGDVSWKSDFEWERMELQ